MQLPIRLATSPWEGHAVAALATGAALLLRYSINDVFDGELPLMTGTFAVIIAAWYGGFWPGLLATVLSAISCVTIFADAGKVLQLDHGLLLSGFVFIGTVTSLLFEAIYRAHLRISLKQAELLIADGERERSRTLASEAELRYWLVIEASRDAVYEWVAATDQTIWNEGLNSLFAYPRDIASLGRTWWRERIHPVDRDRSLDSLNRAIAARTERWSAEYRFLCADGRYLWVLDRARLVYDDQGQVSRIVGAMQDISERQRFDETRAHFQALFEAQPASILVIDPRLHIVAASDAYLQLMYRSREEIVGRPVFDVFPDDIDAEGIGRLRASFERVLAGGQPEQMSILPYAIQKSASQGGGFEKRYWSAYHFPVLGPHGDVAFIIQSVDEVTPSMLADRDAGAGTHLPGVQVARDFEQAQVLARANQRLGAAYARLAFFADLSEATRPLLDPQKIVAVVAEKLGRYMGVNRCVWGEFNEDGESFEVLSDYADGVVPLTGKYRLSDFGIEASAFSASPQVSADIEVEDLAPAIRLAYRQIGTRAAISVPCGKTGAAIAGLAVHQSLPREWMADEIALVEQVAERCWDTLERVRALRALANSEARLRGLLDAMPVKVGTTTADGSVDYRHGSWMAYTGLRYEEMSGENWRRLFHPEDVEAYWARRQESLVSGQAFAHEVRVRRHDGEYRWHLARLSPINNDEGAIQSWVSVVTEIHEFKQAEETLRLRARQLGFLVELSAQIQALSDLDAIVGRVTQALVAHLSVDRCVYVDVEPDEDHYVVLAEVSAGLRSRNGRHRFSDFGAEAISALRANLPYVSHNTQAISGSAERAAFAEAQIGSLIFYPLHTGGRFVAGLAVHQENGRRWTQAETELVGLTARMCWAGLERANAVRHLRRSNEHLRFLAQLSEQIQPLTDPDVIAQTVCEAVGRRLGVSRCAYVRVEADGEHYHRLAEYAEEAVSPIGRRNFRMFGSGWWRRLQQKQTLVIHDIENESAAEIDIESCRAAQIGATILVPLHVDEQMAAIFNVRQSGARTWTEAEIEAVDLAANLCFESIKRASSAAREVASRQQLRDILDRVPEKIITMSPEGVLDYVSTVTLEYHGGVPELHNGRWTALVHPDDADRAAAMLARMIADENPGEEEMRLRRYDGSYRWHLARFAPLRANDDRVILWIGAWSDLHDLKAAELRLRDAGRAKDEFIATLAHELRNPIGPVANGLQLLHRAGEDHKLRAQTLALMSRQLDQLVRLVDDLMDVSRITTGKLQLKLTDVALSEVVRNAVESVEPLIRLAGHRLQISLPDEPLLLRADPTRLAQILVNLLTNSAKYSEHPGVIHLAVLPEAEQIRITVQDEGIGIAPDLLPRVFEMFAQSDRGLQRSGGGLGIGLSLVRRLVELHGGEVHGESPGPGLGSTFTVLLPRLDARSPQPLPAPARQADARAPAALKCRVLVADDNEDNAKSLAALLRIWGHEVVIAYDGESALQQAETFRPEAMVLDLGMPVRDGLETAREVRRKDWGSEVLLIALSGWGQASDRERSQAAGFDHHMVKPVDSGKLEKLLEQRSQAARVPR